VFSSSMKLRGSVPPHRVVAEEDDVALPSGTSMIPASRELRAAGKHAADQSSFSSDQRTTTRGNILGGRIVPAGTRVTRLDMELSLAVERVGSARTHGAAALRHVRVGRRPAPVGLAWSPARPSAPGHQNAVSETRKIGAWSK